VNAANAGIDPGLTPLPEISERMRPFWTAAAQGRLVLARCRACETFRFPAVETCTSCLAPSATEWVEASGRGVVFSFVVMHQVYHPAFAEQVPYAVVDIKLEEGPRMISRLLDVASADIRVGMPVHATFVRMSDTIYLPMFRESGR
jgi:uncharacterized OB-fold protein